MAHLYHHKEFSEQFTTLPRFGHVACGVNRSGSGTSIHLSYVRSFLLGWEKYGAPLDEREFKLMKSPQPTPRLWFLLFQGERAVGCHCIWTQHQIQTELCLGYELWESSPRPPYSQPLAVSPVPSRCSSLHGVSQPISTSKPGQGLQNGEIFWTQRKEENFCWFPCSPASLKANKSLAWGKISPVKIACFLLETSVHYQGMSTQLKEPASACCG